MINYDFNDKVALITAASKGIGFSIANTFFQAGAKVAICSRDKSTLDESVDRIGMDDKSRIVGFQCDLSNMKDCVDLVKKVENHYESSVDILVNNSGGPPPMPIKDTKLEDWSNAINQNLLSSIMITNAVFPTMAKKGFGRIIYLTSTVAKEPAENMVLSNVTRAGVAAFSKTLSREIPANSGITVNTILTGGCKTDRFYSLIEQQASKSNETVDEVINRHSQNVPVGYFATPEEFSKTILFLASKDASYINGVALPLDGGASRGVF
jgi:3-oxoacyl-[acyl-carrier protein] reductase